MTKEDNARYHKDWYYRNKEKRYQQIKARRDEIVEYFRAYKRTLQCNRCSENHPACLQFHHTNPNEKAFSICLAISAGFGIERIMREIAKCEVICANCHTKEHYAHCYDAESSNW